jgi:uncharacterized membrane protein
MKALARVPSAEGMAAMQSINVVVLNPPFLGAFMGTAAISLVDAVLAVNGWETPSAPFRNLACGRSGSGRHPLSSG